MDEISFPRCLLIDIEGVRFLVDMCYRAFKATHLYVSVDDYVAARLCGRSTLFPIPGEDFSIRVEVVPEKYMTPGKLIWRA